jgi:hypothetical protein
MAIRLHVAAVDQAKPSELTSPRTSTGYKRTDTRQRALRFIEMSRELQGILMQPALQSRANAAPFNHRKQWLGQVGMTDDGAYLSVDKLKKQYYDYLGAKTAEIEEARQSRHYYHGDQWTEAEIAVLQRRKQPVVTSNRIERKINAVVGIVEKLRQDPKAYARTPQHEQGADVATAVMRYCLDTTTGSPSHPQRAARAIDGIAGVEFDLETGDHGDPDLGIHIVYADTFFYDPRSFDEGFTDARYMGIAKWIDVDQAKELIPSKARNRRPDGGRSDITSSADQDRERVWVNTSLKRLRLVDHWYIQRANGAGRSTSAIPS